MSDIPRIIINKTDLDKHQELLESYWLVNPKDKDKSNSTEVMEYLLNLQKCDGVVIAGITLVTCQPEFTYFYKNVRKKLEKLNIEFALEY